ncbi:hypothetical protein [Rubrolithibacter danxiaensis]|uniref:hypothetical protein n=1 Tax=Rubrolithibacter danxiaensis TaxID=3390805 RepID=UPI003BF8E94C
MRYLYYFIFSFLVVIFVYHTWFEKALWFNNSSHKVKDRRLREISGLVFSVQNQDKIWVHNDGRQRMKLVLIDEKGNTDAVFRSKDIITDWEDIAIDVKGKKGKPYVYVGDIGDNDAKRPVINVVRFAEPAAGDEQELQNTEKIYLKYPDGSHDAEAMFIDPISRQLYIITKREENVGVYSAPISAGAGDTVLLKKAAKLNLKGVDVLRWVTGADISRDGSQILIRSYGYVYYWKRNTGQSVEQALREEPDVLPHASEIQGEAIGFIPEGNGFYTLSEGKHVALNFTRISTQ